MKKMLNSFILFTSATAVALLLIGCGKGNDNGNTSVNQACSTGYYFYNNTCVPIGGGGLPQTPGFLYTNGFYADNYSGTTTLRITNVAKMEEFFQQGMGVCNRAGKNYGTAACTAYSSGYTDIIIQFPNTATNTLLATFIAQPRNNGYYSYGAQLPSGQGLLGLALGWTTGIFLPDTKAYYGALKNPLQLEMQVSAINGTTPGAAGGTGFQAQGYGDFWTGYNRTLIAIQVPKGKPEDQSFNFNFMVQNQTAVQGTMTRCRFTNCNLY